MRALGKFSDHRVYRGERVMLARLGKVIFWSTLNVAVIDFRTTMILCIVIIGIGLGALVSFAGSDYV